MGGHFFCLPIADGECWGSAAPMHGFPSSFFRCKIYAFSLSIRKIDLAPFCIFAFLHFCKCETASVRQLKQVSLRSLTRSFVILCFCVFAFCKCETASVRQLKQVSLRSLTRIFVNLDQT